MILLDADERFARQLALIGRDGQDKLAKSRVLIVGAGGLGCPAALYLASAGVGTLGIVDADHVEVSNLHRQILHRRVGELKVTSAQAALRSTGARVIPLAERLTNDNVRELTADYDVIVDGSDNLPTRYALDGAGKTWVHGSIFRFDGSVTVFREPYCYRCLYPEPPAQAPSCAEAGVLGVLPGVIGTLQATETLKLLLGIGEPLLGRLLTFDALAMRFTERRFSSRCAHHAATR